MTIEINNIAGIVRTHAATQPTKVALVQGDKTQTWGQLYERSCRVANALKLAGVGPQDRVAFLDKNGIDHFEVFMRAVCSMPSAWISTGDLHHQRWRSSPTIRPPRYSLSVLTLFRCLMQLLAILSTSRQSLSLVVTVNFHRLPISRQAVLQLIQMSNLDLVMWHFSCTQAAQRVGQKGSCSPTQTFCTHSIC